MTEYDVLTEEEAGTWEREELQLKALLKMVTHVWELHDGEQRHVDKKKKLSSKQENPEAVFLTFCHHYFVVHPGANADKMEEFWKDDDPFPRKKVEIEVLIHEWFATFRQNYRKRVKVSAPLSRAPQEPLSHSPP